METLGRILKLILEYQVSHSPDRKQYNVGKHKGEF